MRNDGFFWRKRRAKSVSCDSSIVVWISDGLSYKVCQAYKNRQEAVKADQNVEILEISPQKHALEFYLHRELFLTVAPLKYSQTLLMRMWRRWEAGALSSAACYCFCSWASVYGSSLLCRQAQLPALRYSAFKIHIHWVGYIRDE